MALTRKFLSALGIEQDKTEEIIAAHAETVDALKQERDNLKAEAAKLCEAQTELDSAKKELAEYKNSGWEAKYKKMEADFNAFRAETTAKETKAAKTAAYRKMLRDAGVADKRIDAVLRVTDVDGVELDENGEIKDYDRAKEAARSEWSDFIQSTVTVGAKTDTPPAFGGGASRKTKEEIFAIKDAGERQKAIAENHELFGI